MKIDELLWKMILTLNRSKAGAVLVKGLYRCGLVYIYNEIVYARDAKRPTEEMIDARAFFQGHRNEVEFCKTKLWDEKSRDVYQSAVNYRMSHKRKDRPRYSRGDQYFPKDVIYLGEEEVFIDCGAYIGDTIQPFLKQTRGQFRRIVAFEPDRDNANVIRRVCAKLTGKRIKSGLSDSWGEIVIKEAAVSKESGSLIFEFGLGSGSKVSETGKSIPALAIDDCQECCDATFIKMDIEGSEYDALLGAKKTIQKNHPKLAICIYHSDKDMVRILTLIDSWNLGYKFHVRHHAQKTAETVLYAIPDR